MSNHDNIGAFAKWGGNLKVIVNEYNNSLIIQATQADYDFLIETIKQLDVLPRQCLIEAKVYSVTLTDDLSFGVSAFLEKRGQLATAKSSPEFGSCTTTLPAVALVCVIAARNSFSAMY